MIFPIALPDETLASLLARVCRLNGIADFRDLAAELFDQPADPTFIDTHIDFPEFCRQTNAIYGDPEVVIERFTWVGALVRLGDMPRSIMVEMENGALKPTLEEVTFPRTTILSYCPTCRSREIRKFGVSYWHRVHQLPIVRVCPQHGGPTVRVVIKRASLRQTFPLPGDFELGQHRVLQEDSELPWVWQGVACWVSEALAARKFFDRDTIREALLDALRARSLVTPQGALRKKEVIAFLHEQFGETTNSALNSRTWLFVNRALLGLTESADAVTFGRCLLQHLLYGNWASFEENCLWSSVFRGDPLSCTTNGSPPAVDSDVVLHYREICLGFIQEHADCTRLDFTRAEYNSFQWLLQNDKSWLDKQLPAPTRVTRQLSLF